MNIFELLVADQAKLTTAQKSLQRTLRTFIITLITGTIMELAILFQKNMPLSFYSLSILVLYAVLVVAGHAIEPVLLAYGFSVDKASAVENDIETVAASLPHTETQPKANEQQVANKDNNEHPAAS